MPIYPTRYWRRVNEKVIQCDLCPNYCKLLEGKRGRCFVRGNEGGRMALYTDKRTSGLCVDPIEKKPLNHFLPGTRVLSFGSMGCNLSCRFCQNWHITRSKDEATLVVNDVDPSRVVQLAKRHKCDSIAFTYNDPVIFLEFAMAVSEEARREGIKVVAVTAGYICEEPRKEFFDGIDATNVDLKGFSDRFYSRLCNAKLAPVLDTLCYIRSTGTWMEITNLMIPGWNDDPAEVKAMCKWIHDHLGDSVPLHFTAFHPDSKMMDTPHTPHETLITARRTALEAGLRYVYTGNVHDARHQSTYCHACGKPLVVRDWYHTEVMGMDNEGEQGFCLHCGASCAGVFRPSKYGDVMIDRPMRVTL